MRCFVALSLTLAILTGCSDDGESPEPLEVKDQTFNVALAGAFIPYEAERREYIAEAIAGSDADVLCLQEVWTQEDKELFRDTAIDAYPYSAFFRDDLDTAIDDPEDQQGEIPPTPTTVPCPELDVGNGVTIAD